MARLARPVAPTALPGSPPPQMFCPPDTSIRAPLAQANPSDRIAAAAPPMSSGRPTRPSGIVPLTSRLSSGLSRTAPPAKSEAMAPGARTLTRIPASPELLGQVACQHFDRALGRRVGRVTRQREAGQSRRDVEDAPAVGQERQHGLGQEERSLHVGPDQGVELRLRRLYERGVDAHAGVVDEDVELLAAEGRPQSVAESCGEPGEGVAVGDVERQHEGPTPERGDLRSDGVGVFATTEVRADEVGALPGEMKRDAAAETAAGAGDEGDASSHGPSVRGEASARRARCRRRLAQSSHHAVSPLALPASRAHDPSVVTALDVLRDLVRRHGVGDAASTPIPRIEIRTGHAKTPPMPAIYPTMVCFVLQGAKRVAFGGRTLVYRGESYMLLSADLPVTGQVIEATPRAPYLAVSLLLDPAAIADLVIGTALPPPATSQAGLGIGRLTADLQDPLLRLLRLLDAPGDIRVLAPLAERELLYRLLQGPHGALLRQLAVVGSRLSQVRRAIEWIRADVARTLRVETLSALVGMSAASFHRHFKAVTGLSPLQYQKQIRLQEARRRLLAEPGDVTSVALGVGYESTSQFTREYGRFFGLPPAKDAARLRLAAAS